jgi:hypothetical protein
MGGAPAGAKADFEALSGGSSIRVAGLAEEGNTPARTRMAILHRSLMPHLTTPRSGQGVGWLLFSGRFPNRVHRTSS